ncbi:tumor necrosis factor ligand superfamily member 15 isoform X1 [Grammomys surdaster]|uniref:tumor necrosis factor ligand superfamily member 15 isoform X1 n=1 Tax=Grammomys surdaster TaxID=491861 RepID=UPI0010A0C066|nr:tumor necrosis factor ligand superfamily member 15 isoform X1 [Grammomys surdaster]
MAEELGLGFGEAAPEMLPEGCRHRPEARAGLAARSKACLALTCCLLSFPILAGLSTLLMSGQLRVPGKDCIFPVISEPRSEPSIQPVYTPSRDKPRAHLTIRKQTQGQHLENQLSVLHWEHEVGLAFTKNWMNYTSKFLVIPESGAYFIYSQITFRGTTSECGDIIRGRRPNKPDSITVVINKVADSYPEPAYLLTGTKSVCEISSKWFQPLYLGAVLFLEEGDRLMVNVSDISLVDYTREDKTFFGAYLL